jgi:ubiquitin carboxyl-terminal hydrolase 8
MNATKLEDALSLLPEPQRRAFDLRHKADLVVVYDGNSKTWPKDKEASPLSRVWDIVYEHEFTKKLERTPVLLVGGYAGWLEFIKGRAAFHAANAMQRHRAANANV